jgi:hypothetical protein
MYGDVIGGGIDWPGAGCTGSGAVTGARDRAASVSLGGIGAMPGSFDGSDDMRKPRSAKDLKYRRSPAPRGAVPKPGHCNILPQTPEQLPQDDTSMKGESTV